MRPSRGSKPDDLVHDRSRESSKVNLPKHHRLRRRRKDQVRKRNEEHATAPVERAITKDEPNPQVRSQIVLGLPLPTPKSRSDEMPSGDSISSFGVGPKLTKTGRVSRARKGVKGAHRCGCGKTYSRAEHLRRHQQNHEKRLPCLICGKTFHRQDLYERHLATKHESSNPASRRDSATSGSLSASLPAPALQSNPSFSLATASTHISPEATNQLPNASQYNSDGYSSEAPARYSAHFVTPSTPNIVFFSDPISTSDISPFESTNPASQSDTSYIKDEPYGPTFFRDIGFAQFQPPAAESRHPTTYLGTRLSHSSSGDVSPFSPFSFSASWAGTSTIYTQPHLTEAISFAVNSNPIASPRTFTTNAQMPNWLEAGTDAPPFPASAITSPASSCAPSLVPFAGSHSTGGAPYPLPYIIQRDKYGCLDLESPLEEQQLGIELSLKTKQHYLEAYWTHFDPMFPTVHKGTHRPASNPLLTASMMAIGAQYIYEPFARGDSKILHGKCLELIAKYKDVLSTGTRQDYMQAVFLVEVFAQFKAKRSPTHLSDVFLSMYASLWKFHSNTGRSYIESLNQSQPLLNGARLKSRWAEWTAATGFARLLSACFIFETIQALSLARTLQSTPASGLELIVPCPAAIWDAPDHESWQQAMETNHFEIMDVSEALERTDAGVASSLQPETFHSMILLACQAASVLYQKQELQQTPFVAPPPTHPAFDASNVATIAQSLCADANVSIMYNFIHLVAHTPVRAILATSGESWVLCQRLSQEALIAAAEFTTLKTKMRQWTETAGTGFFQNASDDNVRSAVQHALTILRLTCDIPPASLAFGADMALYHACLVLWAITFGATSRAVASGIELKHDDGKLFDALHAQRSVKSFCDFASTILSKGPMDEIVLAENVQEWASYIQTVLQWAGWTLGGNDVSNAALGELMQNAIGVLGRLANRGLEGDWF